MKFSDDSIKSKILEKAKYIFAYNIQYDRINSLSNRTCKFRPLHPYTAKVFVKFTFLRGFASKISRYMKVVAQPMYRICLRSIYLYKFQVLLVFMNISLFFNTISLLN